MDKYSFDNFFDWYVSTTARNTSFRDLKYQKSCYFDFVNYCSRYFPKLQGVLDVKKEHALKYCEYLKKKGRFTRIKVVEKTGKRSLNHVVQLSHTTIKSYRSKLLKIFKSIDPEKKPLNPFSFPFMSNNSPQMSSMAFSREMVDRMSDNCMDHELSEVMFFIVHTGLTVKDMMSIQIKHLFLDDGYFLLYRPKISIPLGIRISGPLLRKFKNLAKISQDNHDAFLYQDVIKRWLKNQASIGLAFRKLMKDVGIVSSGRVHGRDRKINLYNLDSLRYSYAKSIDEKWEW